MWRTVIIIVNICLEVKRWIPFRNLTATLPYWLAECIFLYFSFTKVSDRRGNQMYNIFFQIYQMFTTLYLRVRKNGGKKWNDWFTDKVLCSAAVRRSIPWSEWTRDNRAKWAKVSQQFLSNSTVIRSHDRETLYIGHTWHVSFTILCSI